MISLRNASVVAAVFSFVAVTTHASAQSGRRRAPEPAPTATPAPQAAPRAEAPPVPPAAPDARQLFLEGQEAYRVGDYAGAIRLWEQAIALDPRPALHYNVGQAYGRVGRIEDELASLRRYLDGAPDNDPVMPSARARVAALEARLAQTGIVVSGSYDGARVILDGTERGTMPLAEPLSVRPGSHALDIELEGYLPFHAAVVVPAGERVPVTVVLSRNEAVARNPMRVPIALYATGGALIVAGGVLGTVALIGGGSSVEGTSDADRAHTLAIVCDVSIGVGAAVAVTGLVLHLTGRDDDEGQASASRVRLFPVASRDSVGIAGTF